MTSSRRLAIQSVLHDDAPDDVVQAAEALSNSAALARDGGTIGDWIYLIGGNSARGVLEPEHLDRISDAVSASGGTLSYELFDADLGHAGGHNRLARQGESELVLFLAAAARLAPDAVTVLAETVSNGVGVAGARQVPLDHPKDYDATTGDTGWASAVCSMTLHSAFRSVGGFDEAFFLSGDDVDYSWRLRLAGFRVVTAPAAVVFHDRRLGLDGGWDPETSDVEDSAVAALLLADKYSRSDLVAELRASLIAGNSGHQRAIAEFDRRRVPTSTTARLDPDHHVAQFVRGNHAVHRF